MTNDSDKTGGPERIAYSLDKSRLLCGISFRKG